MNETTIKDIIDEICIEESNAIKKAYVPYHFFSLRHRRAINEILCPVTRVKRSEHCGKPRRITLKNMLIVSVLIFLAALTVVTAGAVISKGFALKVHHDNNEIFAANAEDCPKTIENEYYLSEIPEGYELSEHISSDTFVITTYKQRDTNRSLSFQQFTKEEYNAHIDNEHFSWDEFEIDGDSAIYISTEDPNSIYGIVIWDKYDYVLEISGDFTKEQLIDLAKTSKF